MLHIIHIIDYTFVPLHVCTKNIVSGERRVLRTDCTSRHSSDTQLIGSENTVLDNHRVLISLLEPLISRDLHYRLLSPGARQHGTQPDDLIMTLAPVSS